MTSTWNHTIVSYIQAEICSSVTYGFLLWVEMPRRPWDRACCFFHVYDNKLYSSENCACVDENRKTQKLEPVSSTFRRGARAAYHDEYPRDFGPRIAYTVSLVSDTSRPPIRQRGRDMSAPRPYEPYPFHPSALFTPYTMINFYIYTILVQLLLPYGIYIVS